MFRLLAVDFIEFQVDVSESYYAITALEKDTTKRNVNDQIPQKLRDRLNCVTVELVKS